MLSIPYHLVGIRGQGTKSYTLPDGILIQGSLFMLKRPVQFLSRTAVFFIMAKTKPGCLVLSAYFLNGSLRQCTWMSTCIFISAQRYPQRTAIETTASYTYAMIAPQQPGRRRIFASQRRNVRHRFLSFATRHGVEHGSWDPHSRQRHQRYQPPLSVFSLLQVR